MTQRFDSSRQRRDLLAALLRRLLALDEQLARQPEDISAKMDRGDTAERIDRAAGGMGLGTLVASLPAIAEAAGLRAELRASLERQRWAVAQHQLQAEIQRARASPLAAVGLSMQIDDDAARLEAIDRMLGSLGALITRPDHGEAEDGAAGDATAIVTDTSPESSGAAGRRAPLLTIAEMKLALTRASAVAQISIGKTVGGQRRGEPTGTAWLITPTLALTCWHAIHARGPDERRARDGDLAAQIADGLLTFSFTEIGEGLDVRIELEHAHRSESRLDYAVLRLTTHAAKHLAGISPIPLDIRSDLTQLSELLIIQHPGGGPQSLAAGSFVRYHQQKPERVLYSNRSEGGTSGAPVLSRTSWRAVALHHGTSIDDNLGEGILIRDVLADLQAARPALWDEIRQAQGL